MNVRKMRPGPFGVKAEHRYLVIVSGTPNGARCTRANPGRMMWALQLF